MPEQDTRRCPACGQANACGEPGPAGSPCWCFEQVIDPQILEALPPAVQGKACLCRACASRAPQSQSRSQQD